MCLSYVTEHAPLREDLTCYKVLLVEDDKLLSPVVKFYRWELGKTYCIGKKTIHKHYGEIYEDAFHTYSTIIECFRAGIVNPDTYENGRRKIYRAVIPKDSNYVYCGMNYYTFGKVGGGYASEKLRIIEEVPLSEIVEALKRDKKLETVIKDALKDSGKPMGMFV